MTSSPDSSAPAMTSLGGAERATWAIRLPLDKPLSLNDRQHWAIKAKATRQLRSDTLTLVLAAKIPPHRRIAVGLVWTPKDRRRRDWDNPIPTLKACCDALVDAHVVPDDTHEFMDKSMPQIVAPDGDPRLVLIVHGLVTA